MSKLRCGRSAPAPVPIRADEIEACRQKLAGYLAANGLRFTEPRWKVAQAILSAGRHLDSGEIVSRVHAAHRGVGAATVYRAIKLLCDAGILEESHQGFSGRTVYELAGDEHHDHILCTDCGAVFEFHDESLESAQERIARREGFALSGHRHVLMGRCERLASARPGRKPSAQAAGVAR
jgi:Fur family ferric uptake transcriptional regulator